MLCTHCAADDHEFNPSGICEHDGYSDCTCEYSDTDPAFNPRWYASPFISSEAANMMIATAQLGRADLIALKVTRSYARRARAYARANGHPVADLTAA